MIYVQSELLADTPVLKQLVIDEVVFNFMPESQEWDRVVIGEISAQFTVTCRPVLRLVESGLQSLRICVE